MKTVYEADGKSVTLNAVDARERIAAKLAFEQPPRVGVEVVADGVATGIAVGDGTGEALASIESEKPVLATHKGHASKAKAAAK